MKTCQVGAIVLSQVGLLCADLTGFFGGVMPSARTEPMSAVADCAREASLGRRTARTEFGLRKPEPEGFLTRHRGCGDPKFYGRVRNDPYPCSSV